jgi:hypothetical protein
MVLDAPSFCLLPSYAALWVPNGAAVRKIPVISFVLSRAQAHLSL